MPDGPTPPCVEPAAAVGAALLSKYTAMFFGAAILIWLACVPELRRWFLSPWPYLGGLVALALFVAGAWLGYISVIALRRSEGVFLPAGYVAVACLAAAAFIVRWAWRA